MKSLNEQFEDKLFMFIENLGDLYDGWFLLSFLPPNDFQLIRKSEHNETWSKFLPEKGTTLSVHTIFQDESVYNRLRKKLRNCIFSLKSSKYREGISINGKLTYIEMELVPLQIEKEIYILTLIRDITTQVHQENSNNDSLKKVQRTLLLEYEMHRAIENNEFEVYYQPKLHVKQKKVNIEALIRWFNPRLGGIEPSEFIPLAEKFQIIRPITNIVLKQIFNDYKELENVYKDTILSVNISSLLLKDEEWIKQLKEMVEKRDDMDLSNIELEITEHSLIDLDTAKKGIKTLSELGFAVTLDDFGSKYSSLQYLREIQCQKIKINKSFTKNIQTVIDERRVLQKIIDFAHSLGLEVTAVGIEDESLLKILKSYNCDELQGFWLGKPTEKKLLLKGIPENLKGLINS
ncbi:EAL domain-containing protein [Sutcliffiella cohnii]